MSTNANSAQVENAAASTPAFNAGTALKGASTGPATKDALAKGLGTPTVVNPAAATGNDEVTLYIQLILAFVSLTNFHNLSAHVFSVSLKLFSRKSLQCWSLTDSLPVRVLGARNIKGSKGDHVNSFVRVQFADFDYKDSEVALDNSQPKYDFNVEQNIHIDESVIDTFANKKVVFTLIESLPKEKTAVLGTSELCMGKYFLNYPRQEAPNEEVVLQLPPLAFTETVPINYLNAKHITTQTKDAEDAAKNVPELDISVSISKPLLDLQSVENGNFVTLKLDDAFPLPEEWTIREGNEKDLTTNVFTYTINFLVPGESVPERQISIPNGLLMEGPVSTEIPLGLQPISFNKPNEKKGASGQGSDNTGSAGSSTGTTSTEKAEKQAATAASEPLPSQPLKKISWNVNHLIWLPPGAVVRLRERVMQKAPLEIEFVRELQQRFAHVTDPQVNKYRGKVVVDWSCLMYPKVIGLKGRFPMDTYESAPSSSSDEKPIPTTPNPSSATADKESGARRAGKILKDESNIFKSIGTMITFELLLHKPLLDKKKLQPITKSVRDLIPRRTISPTLLYEKRSQMAEDKYHRQVQDIVHRLATEYHTILKATARPTSAVQDKLHDVSVKSASKEEEQQRRKRLLFHLNRSGIYFQFKEQLKGAVIEIVRERFQKKTPFTTKAELQLFMSETYVYLVDQMHAAITKMFKVPANPAETLRPNVPDMKMLKSFANAAELDGDILSATRYHQECVANYDDNMQSWFEYGTFCMRNGMGAKGEECFKEILSRNAKHLPSLLAYGAICCVKERFEESRVYLSTAVDLQPKYVLAHTILGLYYDTIEEEEEAELHLTQAAELHKATSTPDTPSHMIAAAEFLINVHAGQLAERALSQELLLTGSKVIPRLLLAQLESQRHHFDRAEQYLREALESEQDNPNIWANFGHLHFIQKRWEDAKAAYETVLTLPQDPVDLPLVYRRLGRIYVHQVVRVTPLTDNEKESTETTNPGNERASSSSSGDASQSPKMPLPVTMLDVSVVRQAKATFLRACEIHPTAESWLGVGQTCMFLGEYDEAEDALSEANVLNNRDCEVWASLAVLCLVLDRRFEATQAISQCLALGLPNPETLLFAGSTFLKANIPAPAIECLRKASEILFEEQHLIEHRRRQREEQQQKLEAGDVPLVDINKKAATQSGEGLQQQQQYQSRQVPTGKEDEWSLRIASLIEESKRLLERALTVEDTEK